MPELDARLFGTLVVAVFVAGVTNGAAGLGFSQVMAAVFGLLLEPRSTVALLSILVPLTSGVQVIRNRAELARFGRLRSLYLACLVGVPLGVLLLTYLPARLFALLLGIFTLVFVATSLRKVPLRVPPERERVAAPLVGLASGICSGTIGVSGPVLGAYLLTLDVPAATFAFALGLLFVSMSLLRLSGLTLAGAVTPQLLGVGLALVPSALAGQQLGFWLQDRISRSAFRRAVLALLCLAGLGLVQRGLGL